VNKEDCSGYETCRKYSGEEDLHCEDCDHFLPTSCFEDYGGRKPFWIFQSEESLDFPRKKKVWLAFSGKAGCGKTTIAKNLEVFGFTRLSFATRLKEISQELFPKIMSKKKEELRPTLQLFGCFCRLIESSCWINIVIEKLDKLNPKNRIVIDDMRFLNEFDALRWLGFKLIRVHRSKALRRTWGYNVDDEHPSEKELDHITTWDLKVVNNGRHPFNDATRKVVEYLKLKGSQFEEFYLEGAWNRIMWRALEERRG